ncbi:MAG: glycosyltransferase family 2 protein [Bacteroidetes bacterium]|nr:glycosyltransferase family 2 protein [Bacteroidota bacterium]
MNYPKITIITPSFNQGQFLEETIQSVLGQNYPNLEYIIMDGGSSDNSIEIIKKYEHGIAIWKSEKDKGQSDAINKGLRIATGEIVGWLNSDDLLSPGSLFELAKVFNDSRIQIIFSPINIINSDSKICGVSNRKVMDFNSMLFGSQVVNQEGIFWRREVNGRIGHINIGLHYAMDYDFFLRCCQAYKPTYVPYKFASHRKHSAQKTNSTDGYLKEMTELRMKYKKELGYGDLYFWINSLYQSRRRIVKVFGIKNFFRREWMDRKSPVS